MTFHDPMNPHVDFATDRIPELLAMRGHDPLQVETDSSDDPYTPAGIIRRQLAHAHQHVPFMFRAAVPTEPEVIAWVDRLAKEAGGRVMPAVGHGPSLLLFGPVGTGKTYESFGAIRLLAATGVQARWAAISAADLYAALRPRTGIDSEQEFRRYADTDVLLVDDIGAGKQSEWTEEVNFRLVNARYENQRPTIFTTNLKAEQIRKALGDRVTSRLNEMCTRIAITGGDRRSAA